MDHVITRTASAKYCMINQGIKRIPLTNGWITTEDGNHLFITDEGEMKTGPEGKTVGYTKDSPAGQIQEQFKSGQHMPESTYSRGSTLKASPAPSETKGDSTRTQHMEPRDSQKAVVALATKYPADLYEGKGEYGQPHGIVSVNPNDPTTAKLSVERSYDIKDDLKSRGYKFDGNSRTWVKSGTNEEIGKEVEYLKGKGAESHISDGQALGVTALVGKYGADGAKSLAGNVPTRDLMDAIDDHASKLGLTPTLPRVGKDATRDEKVYWARANYQ